MTLDRLTTTIEPRPRQRRRDAREFRLMYSLAFPLFVAVSAVRRLAAVPRGKTSKQSLISEAKSAANTCLPFAFMN